MIKVQNDTYRLFRAAHSHNLFQLCHIYLDFILKTQTFHFYLIISIFAILYTYFREKLFCFFKRRYLFMKKTIVTRVLAAVTGAMIFAGMFTAGVSAPAPKVEAASYTTMQAIRNAFDANFYANKYADVKKAFGTNADALYQHFATYGMSEGRMMNANFDPKAYVDAYSDVKGYCNGDIRKAYEHYVEHGMYEGRNLTTYEALNKKRAEDAAKQQQQQKNNQQNQQKKTTPPTPKKYSNDWWQYYYSPGNDTWIWAYYDIYGSFPSWINYQDNGEWDYRLLKAYYEYYGTLPNQKKYSNWDWGNAYYRLYGDNGYYGDGWWNYTDNDALTWALLYSMMQ